MGELGEALALMHRAGERFETLRATVREWYHAEDARRAGERYAATPDGREEGWADLLDQREEHGGWQSRESVLRLWVEKPDRVREEREGGAPGLEIGIRDGELWWMYDPEWGVESNEDDPSVGSGVGQGIEHLLDPAPLLGALKFKLLGRSTVAGRDAIRLQAQPRANVGHSFALIQLGREAEEYEVAIDAERGVILREAALSGGREYRVTEMLEVAFDERFPPGTFTLTLPSGEAPRRNEDVEPQQVELEEAARLASFPVFAARLPSPWLERVSYFRGDPRQRYPETVAIHYWLEDASHQVSLLEHAADELYSLDEHFRWERIERDGEQLEVSRQTPPVETRVRVTRDGTSATLSAANLPLDDLVDLALALERVQST
jgi:outer membrane lipoprotein-sorting protein